MKVYEVRFRAQARHDMITQLRYLSEKASPTIAHNYLIRIKTFCLSLATFPQRGTEIPGNLPGIRMVGFERRVTILFRIEENSVRILRVLFGGQDIPIAIEAIPKSEL